MSGYGKSQNNLIALGYAKLKQFSSGRVSIFRIRFENRFKRCPFVNYDETKDGPVVSWTVFLDVKTNSSAPKPISALVAKAPILMLLAATKSLKANRLAVMETEPEDTTL